MKAYRPVGNTQADQKGVRYVTGRGQCQLPPLLLASVSLASILSCSARTRIKLCSSTSNLQAQQATLSAVVVGTGNTQQLRPRQTATLCISAVAAAIRTHTKHRPPRSPV